MVLSCAGCSVCSLKMDSTPFLVCSVPWAAPPPRPLASLTCGIQLSYYPDQEGCRWEHREVGVFPLLPHCSGHHSTISACTRQPLLPGSALHARSPVPSVQFSRSVMSDSLRPHESQHARPPCPSPTPRVHPDSRPSSP